MRIEHTLGSLTDQGDIRITTANQPPDAIREWGLAGFLGGIGAFHNGEGNIMMDLSSRVEGSRTGITAKHDGEGDLSIIVGSAIPAAPDGTIRATGNRPTDHAIDVTHSGAGRITITLDGDVTSAGGNGVNATTGANGTGITINLGDGNVAGGRGGINVLNGGLGDVSITTADAAVIGTTYYGIQVRDQNRGGVFVTTGTGNADGLAVKGGLGGVHVSNQGQGSIEITVGNGDIEGTRLQGIYARNMGDAGAISITLNGTAAVTGGYNGMYVYNSGLDATTIDLSGATGIVAGRNEDGLSARAGYSNAGNLTITTGAGAGGVAVIGTGNGIDADHVGSGSINITSGSGSITGNGINGIEARLSDSGRDITIMTGVGTVAGGTDGIFTDNAGVVRSLNGHAASLAVDASGGEFRPLDGGRHKRLWSWRRPPDQHQHHRGRQQGEAAGSDGLLRPRNLSERGNLQPVRRRVRRRVGLFRHASDCRRLHRVRRGPAA